MLVPWRSLNLMQMRPLGATMTDGGWYQFLNVIRSWADEICCPFVHGMSCKPACKRATFGLLSAKYMKSAWKRLVIFLFQKHNAICTSTWAVAACCWLIYMPEMCSVFEGKERCCYIGKFCVSKFPVCVCSWNDCCDRRRFTRTTVVDSSVSAPTDLSISVSVSIRRHSGRSWHCRHTSTGTLIFAGACGSSTAMSDRCATVWTTCCLVSFLNASFGHVSAFSYLLLNSMVFLLRACKCLRSGAVSSSMLFTNQTRLLPWRAVVSSWTWTWSVNWLRHETLSEHGEDNTSFDIGW